MWLPFYGITFLLVLVCRGLCLEELSTYLPVGGSLEGRGVLRFGRWCQSVFCGVFGRKEIVGVSRILESSMEDIFVSFLHTLYLWMVAFLSPLSISFTDFLVHFSIPS
jgi:hypothetical protein